QRPARPRTRGQDEFRARADRERLVALAAARESAPVAEAHAAAAVDLDRQSNVPLGGRRCPRHRKQPDKNARGTQHTDTKAHLNTIIARSSLSVNASALPGPCRPNASRACATVQE